MYVVKWFFPLTSRRKWTEPRLFYMNNWTMHLYASKAVAVRIVGCIATSTGTIQSTDCGADRRCLCIIHMYCGRLLYDCALGIVCNCCVCVRFVWLIADDAKTQRQISFEPARITQPKSESRHGNGNKCDIRFGFVESNIEKRHDSVRENHLSD